MVDERLRTAEWDPITLTYASEGEEIELPLRLLVLGRFSAGEQQDRMPVPVPVGAGSIDPLLSDFAPELRLSVPDRLVDGGGTRDFHFVFRALEDFTPDRLVEASPDLAAVQALIDKLRRNDASAPPAELASVLTELGWEPGRQQDAAWCVYAAAELGHRLGRQLDELLHHPEFQALEANWRGLALIAAQLDNRSECRLDLLDLDKEALRDDFRSHASADESLLFQTLYTREFGQYGGEPYAAVLAAYSFGPGNADIELLRAIASVAAAAHAPFIADADAAFFNLQHYEQLADASSLADIQRGARFAKWHGLVEEDDTRYVALTAPRVLLRAPYDYRRGDMRVAYRESIAHRHTHCLWGSAALAFAGCLLRSYQRYRVCVDVVGPLGGRLEGLPVLEPDLRGEPVYPVEVQLSERKEAELAELGFMPLTVARAHGYLSFNSAHSIHWGALSSDLGRRNDSESLGLRLGAQLPYVFLVSRIAHYLKVIQRDMLGSVHSPAEMEAELNTWLRRYVSDVENPSPAVRARRPLRHAELSVQEDTTADRYRLHLKVIPHAKHLGADFSLSLESRLGKPLPAPV